MDGATIRGGGAGYGAAATPDSLGFTGLCLLGRPLAITAHCCSAAVLLCPLEQQLLCVDTGNRVPGLIAECCGAAGSLGRLAGFTLMLPHELPMLVLWRDRQLGTCLCAV